MAFHDLNQYVEKHSDSYNKGAGWKEKDLIKVLNEGRKSITFSMVRGYYEKLWNEIYPHQPLPIYLRVDTSNKKFEKEIARHIKRWEAHKQ